MILSVSSNLMAKFRVHFTYTYRLFSVTPNVHQTSDLFGMAYIIYNLIVFITFGFDVLVGH